MSEPSYIYRANIARIVDGDTFDLDIDLGLGVWKRGERIRLYGIDVAERNTDLGKQCIQYLRAEVFPMHSINPIIIHTIKDKGDKYGRYLAKILPAYEQVGGGWTSLTDLLIEKGYGTAYFGGSRTAQ